MREPVSSRSSALLTGRPVRLALVAAVLALGGSATSLAAASPAQPANLTAFHRSGQTFLTWNERTELAGEQYHIYRYSSPITSANLQHAARLTSRWGPLGEGSSIFWSERDLTSAITPNYVLQDLGTPLADTTGVFVWTSAETNTFYYAVTTVLNGVENTADFGSGNATGPIAETVAAPAPVLVWTAPTGRGFVYTQYLDYDRYNPTFGVPRRAFAQQIAFNYAVMLPADAACGGSLPATLAAYVYFKGWGGRYKPEQVTADENCAVEIMPDDPNQTWYFGHSASYDYRQGGTASTGPIVNFTEERILRAVYDTLRDARFRIDPQRIYIYGHSMGGSGALAFGLRYPNVFATAYASEPMTNFRTADGAGGTTNWVTDAEHKWGTVSADLPIEIRAPGDWAAHLAGFNGVGVWDWQNHQEQLNARRGDDMAFIGIAHGTADDTIAWASQGEPAYTPFYLSRRAFSGMVTNSGHYWLGYDGLGPTVANVHYDGPFFNFRVRRDETIPALTYDSGSLPAPPPSTGGYNLALAWSASWNPWDGPPVDTATEWRMSLKSTDGASHRVDVTPRRLQAFRATRGLRYAWENRRVADNGLVASGVVTADQSGLVTVPTVEVTPTGNRLRLVPASGASGRRPWPAVNRGVAVFSDQLPAGMNQAQTAFAASHYVGTQKIIRQQADQLRALNPDFLVLHYRLGAGLGYRGTRGACQPTGDPILIIDGNDWVNEWPGDSAVQSNWFFLWNGQPRVLNCRWGWYVTELNDAGWRDYWKSEVVRQATANDADGVFMDSLLVPNYFGASQFSPALPAIDISFERSWSLRISGWLSWLRSQVGALYLVPNVGNWTNSRDVTDYSAADALFVEQFAIPSNGNPYPFVDWQLQMNRVLGTVIRGQVLLTQSSASGSRERMFALGSYLLVKNSYTYFNVRGSSGVEWWPEYDIPLGAPTEQANGAVTSLFDPASGVYRRRFDNGIVLVNATNPTDGSGATPTVSLGGTFYLAETSGGGSVSSTGVPTGLISYRAVTHVTLPPYSAAVLFTAAPTGSAPGQPPGTPSPTTPPTTTHQLAVAVSGAGTVSMAPAGTICGANCVLYSENSTVDLIPIPAAASVFAGWTGTTGCEFGHVVMTTDFACTAHFVDRLGSPTRGAVDMNGDGRADIFAYDPASGEWAISFASPAGGPGFKRGRWSRAWTVQPADFNGDGLTDFLLYDRAGGSWFKVTNAGAGEFLYESGAWSPGWDPYTLDLNADGLPDVFLYNPQTGSWFRCITARAGGFSYFGGHWSPGWKLYPAELNGDGFADLLLYDSAQGTWFRAIGDGASGFRYVRGEWSPGWEISVGNFNGDRFSDVFLHDRRTGAWFLCLNDGAGFAYKSGAWSPGWTVRTGDLNADGRDDVFLYHSSTGRWYECVSDAEGAFAYTAGSWSPGWQVSLTDVDRDRQADIILYDPATGRFFRCLNRGHGTFSYTSDTWAPGLTLIVSRMALP